VILGTIVGSAREDMGLLPKRC